MPLLLAFAVAHVGNLFPKWCFMRHWFLPGHGSVNGLLQAGAILGFILLQGGQTKHLTITRNMRKSPERLWEKKPNQTNGAPRGGGGRPQGLMSQRLGELGVPPAVSEAVSATLPPIPIKPHEKFADLLLLNTVPQVAQLPRYLGMPRDYLLWRTFA